MSIKLVVEVLDHYHGPDARKLWLLAWAEKANGRTRQGWPGQRLLAHRTGKSASRVSHIADELIGEGTIKRVGGGGRHRGETRYELLPLTAADDSQVAARTQPDTGLRLRNRGSQVAESGPQVAESGPQVAPVSPLPAETSHIPQIPQDHPSSLSARGREMRAALAGLDGADEREIDLTIAGIYEDPDIKHPDAYLRRCIASDGGRELLADARRTNPRVMLARMGTSEDETEALLADMAAAGVGDPARLLREKSEEAEGAEQVLERARLALAARSAPAESTEGETTP